MKEKQKHITNCLIIALLCAVAFAPFINGPFLYDDEAIISRNPYIRSLRNIGQFFTVRYWNEIHPGTAGVFRPLRESTFTVLYAVFGANSLAFRAVSLAGHIATSILVYLLALKLLKNDQNTALLSGVLFAVHPVHVEAVLWAKNMAEIQAAVLVIGAFLLFLRAISRKTTRKGFIINVTGASLLYALVLTCKESGLALPLVILLYIFFALPRDDRRMALKAAAPMILLAGAYLVFQFVASELVQATIEGQRQDPDEALILRPALVAKTYAFYFRLLLVPAMLCAQYHFVFPVSYTGPEALPYMIGFLALAGAMLAGILYRRDLAWLILWPALFLGPASNIIPFMGRPVGDQRLYVPSIGFCLLFGLLSSAAIKGKSFDWSRNTAWICAGVISANMLLLAMLRGPLWMDEDRFWLDMLIKSPVQAEAHYQVGRQYWDKGRIPEALEHAERCVDGNPEHYRGYILLGQSLGSLGKHEEALTAFEKALELAKVPDAYLNTGIALMNLGRYDEGIEYFKRSIELFPEDHETYIDLANAYRDIGRMYDARQTIGKALELSPQNARAHHTLGGIALMENNTQEAMRAFEAAVQLEPENPMYLTHAASTAMALNRPEIAREHLQRALNIAPGFPPAVELMRRLPRQ